MRTAAIALLCSLLMACGSIYRGSNHPAICPQASDRPLDLLIVTGGHPYEPSEFFSSFAAMRDVRVHHYFLVGKDRLSVPLGGLRQYDAVLFYDLQPGALTAEWLEILSHARGFIFLHHAIGSFPSSVEFKKFVGGHANFTSESSPGVPSSTFHFNQMQHFTIADTTHPVTCGAANFKMLDEAYDNVDVDPRAHVLMTSDFPKVSPAAMWTWSYDGKRVLYIQPGHGSLWLPADHGPSSYQNLAFRNLLARGIQWAAGRI